MRLMKVVIIAAAFLVINISSEAQNPKILCYFNHPVNTSVSSGTNAIYLNGTLVDTFAAYIDRAKYTVDVAVYNFTSTSGSVAAKIAVAANNAVQRGVRIRWIYDGSSSNTGLSLLNPQIHTLGSPTSSGFGIMHNKFMVIDVNSPDSSDAFVTTGSCNFSDQQANTDYNNTVIIQSRDVALTYYEEFNKMWGGTDTIPTPSLERFGPQKTPSTKTAFNVNGTPVEVYFSPRNSAGYHLTNAINSADYELFFGIYTFTDNNIAYAIRAKYYNGITTKGIMDEYSKSYSPYSTLNPVLGTNLRVYSGSGLYHSKTMIIDALHPASDPQVFTGSFNWTISAENSNDENAVVIHDSIIANEYYQSLCQDFATIGGAACPALLPLELLLFKGAANDHTNVLQWSIAQKQYGSYFMVERSDDGAHFSDIVKVNAGSNIRFSYTDDRFNKAISYYRLRCINIDGSITYSSIIQISNGKAPGLVIYPNPVKDKLYVQLRRNVSKTNTIVIVDIAGRVVHQETFTEGATDNLIMLNVSGLAKGIYSLHLEGEESMVEKFVKE